MDEAGSTFLTPGTYECRSHVPAHFLMPGFYHLLVAANNPHGRQHHLIECAADFEITTIGSLASIDRRLGYVAPQLTWDLLPSA